VLLIERKSKLQTVLKYLAVIVVVAFTVLPFIYTIITSLMPEPELLARPPFPFKSVDFHLANYEYILSYQPFTQAFLFSSAVAIMTTVFVLIAGSLGAYAISHIDFPGNNALFNFIVIVYMLPPLAMLMPIVVTLKVFGLLDTVLGMMFAHAIILLPLMTWFLIGIYAGVPRDINEAMLTDGYTRIKALFKEVVPLSRAGFFLVLIFCFINSWNDLMFANTVGIVHVLLLQPRILEFMSGARVLYGQLAAAGVLSSVPVIALAIVMSKQIIAGIMKGAIK